MWHVLHLGPRLHHLSLLCGDQKGRIRFFKYWEIIADNLSKAGWTWGCVSAIDSTGQTIWIADAHREQRKGFCCARGGKADCVSGTRICDWRGKWTLRRTQRNGHWTKCSRRGFLSSDRLGRTRFPPSRADGVSRLSSFSIRLSILSTATRRRNIRLRSTN